MNFKIIAFPFAGGNKYSFSFITRRFDSSRRVFKVLEYPGRGKRLDEDLMGNIDEIADDAFRQFCRIGEKDHYMIYGHSMGGLIGYLVCKKIKEAGLNPPLKLIVSGSSAPMNREREPIHHLPSIDFWSKINEFGGLPQDILEEPALKTFFEPVLKADFKAIENFQYSGKADLDIPIDVFYGTDEEITEDRVEAWMKETTGPVSIRELSGDHFFIYDHPEIFGKYFAYAHTSVTI